MDKSNKVSSAKGIKGSQDSKNAQQSDHQYPLG